MAGRFIDFDAARAEREQEPIVLRAYGEEFLLPGALPAAVMLDIVRLQADLGDDAEVSTQDAMVLMRRMVSEDVLEGLLERDDFSTDDFSELVRLVMRAYMGGEEPGEAVAPNRAARRSKPASPARGSQGTSKPRPAKASPGRSSSSTGT